MLCCPLLDGISQLPVPLAENVLVVSDNGDIYGTLDDLELRLTERNALP
jgi:hypothetical protein